MQVIEIDRDQVDVGPLARQIVEPASERADLSPGAAGPFREDDQRIPGVQRRDELVELRPQLAQVPRAVDQDRPKDSSCHEPANATRFPVVSSRDRSGAGADLAGQYRPEDDEVEMTGVVGEKDALAATRMALDVVNARATGHAGRVARHAATRPVTSLPDRP